MGILLSAAIKLIKTFVVAHHLSNLAVLNDYNEWAQPVFMKPTDVWCNIVSLVRGGRVMQWWGKLPVLGRPTNLD